MNDSSATLVFARPKGERAYRQGRCLEDNPYLPNSAGWHEWNRGYEDASIERKSA